MDTGTHSSNFIGNKKDRLRGGYNSTIAISFCKVTIIIVRVMGSHLPQEKSVVEWLEMACSLQT